uniref:DUF2335 domain-containing protein n=1 Tax=Muribaculaceae bacterium Z82 TaxID=2304548 RepID=A0A7C9JFD6_9BACT
MLPAPADFKAYPESVQEKIVSWTDESVFGESKRSDKIISVYSRNSMANIIVSAVVGTVIAVGSFVSFSMTGNVAAFAPLAIPGAAIVGNVYITVKGKHQDDGGPLQ